MNYSLFCCLLFFISLDIKTQPTLKDGTEKVDSLLSRVSVEMKRVNPANALELAIEALSLSRDTGYSKGKAMSCFYIGQMLSYLGDYQRSIEYLSLSEKELYSSGNAIMQSEVSRVKGQVYYMLNLKKASFHEFQKAYSYVLRIKDEKDRQPYTSLAYENLALAYKLIKDMPDSTLYWMKKNEELLDATDESRNFRTKINLYTQYGEYYTVQQQYDTATFYFQKAYSLLRQYDYPYSSWLFQRWGNLQREMGNSDSAMVLYRDGLNNLIATNIKNELPEFYTKIAEIYFERGEQDSARWYRDQQQQVTNELANARNTATEEAFAVLFSEEKKLSQTKTRKNISLLATLFGMALLVTMVILHQSIVKRKKNESEVSELKLKLNDAFEEMIELARSNNGAFLTRFKEIYPEFAQNLLARHPDLTNTELRLSALIFLNFSSKEIADCMFITHRSVQTSKGRLRKKLDIPSETNLYQYFKSFS